MHAVLKRLLLAGGMVVFGPAAFAHSPLSATKPADSAVLSGAPEAVGLTFKRNIRLTRVTLSVAGAAAVDLDLGSQTGFVTDFALPVADMGAGVYAVEWRGLGDDGHAQQGTFSFTVE